MTETTPNRDAWRDLVVEEALEPDLPIIDPHHHIWPQSPVPGAEPWGSDDLFRYKTGSGHNIVATMFVESGVGYRTSGPPELLSVGETEYAEQVACDAESMGGRLTGTVAGIVVAADLILGARVADTLNAHLAASSRVRAVRALTAWDPDMPYDMGTRPGMLADPAFREGAAQLASRGLALDVWLMHPQMPDLLALAKQLPDTQFVLDHLGAPLGVGRFAGDAEATFAQWEQLLSPLAKLPNVAVKLGGLNMPLTGLCVDELAHRPWNSDQMAQAQGRHVLRAIELFGPDRCMFESNFPVDRALTNGTVLWNAFKRIAAGFTADEKHALFFGTANRIYRLGQSAG